MKKTIQDIKLHDHTCLMFKNQAEFFHCATPFIRAGLNKNEKCYIIIDEITREDVLRNFMYLFRDGRNPFEEMAKAGKIIIEHFKNIYLIDGVFDIERTIQNYIKTTKDAISKGFSSVRVFAEISSSLKDLIKIEDFLTYEEKIDKYFAENDFLAVCAYNKNCFASEYISKMLKVHPIEIDIITTRL